jgi:hypothetical protein
LSTSCTVCTDHDAIWPFRQADRREEKRREEKRRDLCQALPQLTATAVTSSNGGGGGGRSNSGCATA